MKLKKIINKYNIIELYLLKYQSSLTSIFLKKNKLELHLKQSLKTIYRFHYAKKKIWFIGFPYFSSTAVKSLVENSDHLFLSKINWVKGLIGNKRFVKNDFKKTKNTSRDYAFKHPDLLVIFNLDLKTSETLKEFYKLDTPIIIFGTKKEGFLFFNFLSYVPINVKEKKLSLLCVFLLHSILKRIEVPSFGHGSLKKK